MHQLKKVHYITCQNIIPTDINEITITISQKSNYVEHTHYEYSILLIILFQSINLYNIYH